MDFAGIGKISSFVKQKNLVFAANYKIKTGQSIVNGNGGLTLTKASFFNQVQTSKKSSTSAADKARLAAIKSKLKSGKKLSAAEMSYLKEKDPKTYKKAKYADEAREELKAELRSAKTKQEAREAVMHAMAKIAADCTADFEALKGGAGGGGGGSMNVSGADMNISGTDAPISMNVDAGAENISVENVSTENVSSGETSNVATSENLSTNENSFVQGTNSTENEDSADSAADIMDKYIYAIRAVQDEWLNFMKSDEYKELPEDIFEAAEMQIHVIKKNKFSDSQAADAILAYRAAMNYRLEK